MSYALVIINTDSKKNYGKPLRLVNSQIVET